MKAKHTIQKLKPLVEASGCVSASFKDQKAYVDQTQSKWTTLRKERKNTPANDHSSSLHCKSDCTPRRGKAEATDSLSKGTLTLNIVEENLTRKNVSSTEVTGRKPSQNRVLVLNQNLTAAMPCHPARARDLLRTGKAKVFRMQPFIIVLQHNTRSKQDLQLKIDPGANQSGIALVLNAKRGKCVVMAIELRQRGSCIVKNIMQRRNARRSRRQRKTRYRQARFDNRTKPKGWFAPSILNRVQRTTTICRRICKWAPVTGITIEHVKFDTQKMDNPNIAGVKYQQGTLFGYEIREYLLEKWGRKCAYCNATDLPLQVEHMNARARRGSDRIDNLTIACEPCNQKKGTKSASRVRVPKPYTKIQRISVRSGC